jgi:carboxylate-amine ligase
VLRDEFLNARGAIARFRRSAIEIRLMDVQECPLADLAVCALVVEALKFLLSGETCDLEQLQDVPMHSLHTALIDGIRRANQATIADREYLSLFGLDVPRLEMGRVWAHLFEIARRRGLAGEFHAPLEHILNAGPLASRIAESSREKETLVRGKMERAYRQLCDCLKEGRLFGPV